MRTAPRTPRHTVIGEFRVDDAVPTEVLATLTAHERKVLDRWLGVFQASRAPGAALAPPSLARTRLSELMHALDVAAATLAPADAEAVRRSLRAVCRALTSGASARPGRGWGVGASVAGQGDLLDTLSSGAASAASGPGSSDRGCARGMASADCGSPHPNG